MNMGKIDFMAGLPRAAIADETQLKVGQTWRTAGGHMVTVVKESDLHGGVFRVRQEFGYERLYYVNPNGQSREHATYDYDLSTLVSRVYIAGPMTGLPNLNFPAFNAAAIEYRRKGCFVLNPAEICPDNLASWDECIRKDLAALLTCDAVVMLPGWRNSKGATLEHTIAESLGMTITYREEK